MKNSKSDAGMIQGIESAKSSNLDSINLSSLQDAIKKNEKNLDKIKIISSKSLYKGMEGMKNEDQKKFRSKIRRKLHSFCNEILGKDRKDEDRINAIKSFLIFYKENWKIQDFKIENFSQSKDENDLKDYKNLLQFISDSMK